ncbi:MAG: tRNA guanosine(34) transglycosylase Tgt [Sphingomonadaceae bacterium]|nr:tRNA guanosine(34) transglycosylase Tgt [Sphingomonadaceae bacterium]
MTRSLRARAPPGNARLVPDRFAFSIDATDGKARTGVIRMARGEIRTPAFMPVGTAATVKAMRPADVRATGADIILGNTYHLMLRPGAERIARLGGLHAFMGWDRPILTDSGGYQVMSLSDLAKVSEEGVAFASHLDGSRHLLTPERSIEIQRLLGSDIAMTFDELVPTTASRGAQAQAMERSMRWARRSKDAFAGEGALFGIQQGGLDERLRAASAEALIEIDFDGYAVGGLAVGEGQAAMLACLDFAAPQLPEDRPRYLMGVGKPDDLVGAVMRGIDMFDCVLPTRSGRTGQAFTWDGPLNIRNARFAEDATPLDPESPVAGWSKAYLHHLVRSGEILGAMLMTEHNLWFYQRLMQAMRDAIAAGSLVAFAAEFAARYRPVPRVTAAPNRDS